MKRGIAMSGGAFTYFGHYEQNNQLELVREIFQVELGNETDSMSILNFMKNAPAELIVQRMPVYYSHGGVTEYYWAAVIEGLCFFWPDHVMLRTILFPTVYNSI